MRYRFGMFSVRSRKRVQKKIKIVKMVKSSAGKSDMITECINTEYINERRKANGKILTHVY